MSQGLTGTTPEQQNLVQLAGTALDTNSGNKSAGTIRVVLATDQPTMSNAQPVTANAGTNLNTSLLALESGGNLAAILADTADIETNTANIPALGQAVMASSTPVVIASNQTSVPVTASQATAANFKAQIATTLTSTKAAVAFQTSATNTAGSTTTGSSVDLTTALGCTITALVTNGGTGPTLGCRFRVQVSNDNSTWFDWSSETAPTTNSATTYMQPIILPQDIMYARTVFDSNTAQSVTVQANGQKTSNNVGV